MIGSCDCRLNVWVPSLLVACLCCASQEDMADLLEHYPQMLDNLRALHKDRRSKCRWVLTKDLC
jgi:hypothetical protein